MRIVHVSYARIMSVDDPRRWLKQINFFTGIVVAQARQDEVHSIHGIDFEGTMDQDGVHFHFLHPRRWQGLFPWRINRYVCGLRPDAVIVHGFHHLWSIVWLSMTVGAHVQIFIQHHAEKPFRFPKHVLQSWVDSKVMGYFFTTAGLAESWINAGMIDPSKIFEVMEASSAFHPVDKMEARQKTGVTGNKIYLWVGRLDHNKDPLTLIRAFRSFLREHEEARLYMIYQQDDLLGKVKSLLTEHDQSIILAGKVDHDQLLYWFSSADFIVSTSHYEGSGIAVCEAMSCGCIPVLSDIPSFRKMTDNSNAGLLFNAGDDASLRAALERSVSLPIDIHRKKVLDQFDRALSFEAIARKMRQVLSQSLNNKNG